MTRINLFEILLLFLFLLFTDFCLASQVDDKNSLDEVKQEVSKSTNELNELPKPDGTEMPNVKNYKYFFNLKYAYFDLLIPSKYGFSVGYMNSDERTWEFEYLKGSLAIPFLIKDLGKMSDERYSINTRTYSSGGKFNLMYGVSYNDFSLVIGDKLLNKLSGGSYPSIDLVEIQTLGVNFGLGHRWVFKDRFTICMDWFTWSQPLVVVKKHVPILDYSTDSNDRKNVEDSIKGISYFPRFGAIKFNLGIYF